MKNKGLWLVALALIGLCFSTAQGNRRQLVKYIQQFKKGNSSQKKEAIEKIASMKSPQGMEFLYKNVMTASDPQTIRLRKFTARKMAETKAPHGLLFLFKSFTVSNTSYWSNFKEVIFPHCRKKVLKVLMRPILTDEAKAWAPGKAFFIEVLAAKKIKKASRYLRSLISKDPSPKVRKACVYALLDLDRKRAAPYLAKALTDSHKEVRKAAVLCLGEIGTSQAISRLSRAVMDKEKSVKLAAIEILSNQKGRTAKRVLLRALRDSDEDVKAAALRALRNVLGDQAKSYFIRAASDRDWRVRMVAVFHLKEFGKDPKFLDIYKKRLRDDYPQVASAAVWGLYKLASKKATRALIDSLQFLKSTPLKDAHRALKKLTGKDFGTDYSQWKSWWEKKKSNFTAKRDTSQPYTPPSSSGSSGNGRGTVLRKKPKFFGSVIESYHVGFIIDYSSSMRQKMEITESEGSGRGTQRRKKLKTKEMERIKVAKKELIGAISKLDPRAKFNVFLFGTDYRAWKSKAVEATPKNKDSAIRFVRNNRANGSTNIYDPLEKMLGDEEIDTIYLLSDGSPNRGKYSRPNDIIREIGKINKKRKVVINTIGIGVMSFTGDFLRDLANKNRGKYVKK